MTLQEWRSLWRFTRKISPPELDVTLMCPYLFIRVLWWTTSKEFRAWPATLDSGIVIGWRWPLTKYFKEKVLWRRHDALPLAIYGAPMDVMYLARATGELSMGEYEQLAPEILHIGPTVKALLQTEPRCPHNLWLANCPGCARKALRLAVQLKAKYEPVKLIDPHEDPVKAFRRREAEAQKRLAAIAAANAGKELGDGQGS